MSKLQYTRKCNTLCGYGKNFYPNQCFLMKHRILLHFPETSGLEDF